MTGARMIVVTAAMTLGAGALAWGAFDQVRSLAAMVIGGPVRAFAFEFRFGLGLLAVFIVLSVGEMVVSRVMKRFEAGG